MWRILKSCKKIDSQFWYYEVLQLCDAQCISKRLQGILENYHDTILNNNILAMCYLSLGDYEKCIYYTDKTKQELLYQYSDIIIREVICYHYLGNREQVTEKIERLKQYDYLNYVDEFIQEFIRFSLK